MSAARSEGLTRKPVQRLDRVALIQFVLLVLTFTSIGAGLAKLVKGFASNPTFLFALLGTFTGWQLARSRWNAWKSAGITILCGAVVLLLTVGGVVTPLWKLFTAVLAARLQLLLGQLVNVNRIVAAWGRLGETVSGLLAHIAGWFQLVRGKSVSSDPLVIGILWGLALWLLAGWAAWMVRRRSSVLPALLPGTAVLAWASYYTNSRQSLFALLLVGAVIVVLQMVQNYDSSRRRWQAAGLEGVGVESGLVTLGLGLTVVLVIVGALTPSISIKKTAEAVNKMFVTHKNPLAESLGLQPTPNAPSRPGSAGSFITGSHTVGAGQLLPQDLVMSVVVDSYAPIPQAARGPGDTPESPVRYYWRSQTFDNYNGSGWTTTVNQTAKLNADQPLYPGQETLPENFQTITQHVTRYLQGQAVLVTGELLALDQPATALWRSPDDFAGASTLPSAYTAESQVPLATVETLRQAGMDYPEQIRQYYLQLPDDLPARVRNLALEITQDQTNPYDQATAIETYLRQFPYTLDVPAPPAGRDVADFFLFDLKQGYCDYYATTMVVLARAAGIPARLVMGYSRGIYDETSHAFVVRASNAHAWVEVYFPGTGWIEFEPTGNQPAIDRLHNSNAPVKVDLPPVVPAAPKPSALPRVRRSLDIPYGWLAAAGIALLLGLLIPLEGWLLNLQRPDRALDIVQHRLYRLGHRWYLPSAGALTPYEFSDALAARLETLATTPHLSAIVASICWDLDRQTGVYVRSLYAEPPPSRLEIRMAVYAWPRFKRRLWWLRLRFWRKQPSDPQAWQQ